MRLFSFFFAVMGDCTAESRLAHYSHSKETENPPLNICSCKVLFFAISYLQCLILSIAHWLHDAKCLTSLCNGVHHVAIATRTLMAFSGCLCIIAQTLTWVVVPLFRKEVHKVRYSSRDRKEQCASCKTRHQLCTH